MSVSLKFDPPTPARSLKLRRFSAATVALMVSYIEEWLEGPDVHGTPHTDGGAVGGGEKRVHGIVWGDLWISTTTDIEVVIFYSE